MLENPVNPALLDGIRSDA
jgi:LAGLIDADG endonuclease